MLALQNTNGSLLSWKVSARPAPGVHDRVTTLSDVELQALAKLAAFTTTKWKTLSPFPLIFFSLSCSFSVSLNVHLIQLSLSLLRSFDPSILPAFPLLLACSLPQCKATWTGDESISLAIFLQIHPWFEELCQLLCVLLRAAEEGSRQEPERVQCSETEAVSLLELRCLTLNLFLSAAWDYFCC